MRTNIDIDNALLKKAMKVAGATTKKAAVEEALRRMVKNYEARKAIEDLRGLGWEGDLNKMREGRTFDHIK
jgi:Arc/MetJ family transcription regulator